MWQVGDVGFRFAGMSGEQPRKRVDEIAAAFRAAVIAAEVAAGSAVSMGADDPGRAAALALIGRQGFLRNRIGPYGYAAVDGRPVPPSMVVRAVPPGELVIASDGYPVIETGLAASEATLARLTERDPWAVGERPGTKEADDRAYLRLLVQAGSSLTRRDDRRLPRRDS